MNVLLDDYAEVVRRVAGEEGVELVDVQRLFEAAGEGGGPGVATLLRDGVHPNDRAYRLIADRLHPVLSRMLGAGRTPGDAGGRALGPPAQALAQRPEGRGDASK